VRYDYFLVWGNGLKHVPHIVGMIRDHDNFDIVRMKRVRISSMEQFVMNIYACDTAPWNHLVGKTRYLMKSTPEAVFVLVINKEPDEHEKGKGEFRHLECRKMTALKMAIRNAYNPRFPDNRRVPPLDAGVSHQHCIHGSDYEAQTEHVLGVLGLQGIAYHKRYDNLEYFIPYHLEVDDFKLKTMRVDDLRANVLGKGLVRVEETPHYLYACGDTEPYTDYFRRYFGTKLCEDHFPAAFDELIERFEPEHTRWDGRESYVIVRVDIVLDGVHRVAIAKQRDIKELRCLQIS